VASDLHPSSSEEQRKAEVSIRLALARHLGEVFSEPPPALKGLELDAFAPGPPPVLVEIFAHVGRSKSGQQRKLSRDMTKLLLAERKLGQACRKVVAVIDPAAIAHCANGWDGEFARAFDIELCVVTVDEELHATVTAAQKRQFR